MTPSQDRSCRWVPWAIAGAFSVVVAANGTLAYLAARSSTGLVTAQPFNKGNGYNLILAEAAKQDALGWRGKISLSPRADGPQEIVATVEDVQGNPLSGLTVEARITRPVEPLKALALTLEPAGRNRYAGSVELPRAGQWKIHVTASRGGDIFEFSDRVIVP